ncbi:MAG: sel1 repeat family protein, partial [Planctomycetes bacterium]|nr:sel1 repeat family protein [Planctomycetota bacterium]
PVRTRNSGGGIRGTEFILYADPVSNTDTWIVLEGAVEVYSKSAERLVESGQQLKVKKSGAFGRVKPIDYALVDRFGFRDLKTVLTPGKPTKAPSKPPSPSYTAPDEPKAPNSDRLAQAEKYYRQGVSYYEGVGGDRNLRRAATTLRKAADLGHCKAALYLVDHHEGGERVEDNPVEFIRWLKLAADLNCAEPQFWLGQIYDGGLETADLVIKPNRSQAIHWYDLAAANGHPKAKIRLRQLKGE